MAHVPERMEDMSSYKEGQVHMLMERFEQLGYTAEHLTMLGQYQYHNLLLLVLEGKAEIKILEPIEPAESEPIRPFLEFVSTVTVPERTEKFVTKDRFVRDTGHKAKVKISYLGDNFKAWFLSGGSKTEKPRGTSELHVHKLIRSSVDAPIIANFGGEEKSETTLSEMFALMEMQAKGESGVLLTNGYANIFYVRDFSGVLRAVSVRWSDGGWSVNAHGVTYPRAWDDGGQVFSRNLVLDPSVTASVQV